MGNDELLEMENGGINLEYYERRSEELLEIARQYLEGIAFMHQMGVQHNDLKLSNVAVDEDTGRVSILDFGLATRCDKGGKGCRLDGQFFGTKGWTAPEVGSRKPYYARLADLWAAGKVIMETLKTCGAVPDGEFISGICHELMEDDPDKRPEVEDVVRRIEQRLSMHSPKSDGSSAFTMVELEDVFL